MSHDRTDPSPAQELGSEPTFDDVPLSFEGLPPEICEPLAVFKGAKPPSPAWFENALAQAPERSFTHAPDGRLETLAWGERGKPGLLLVHGNGAHADWWSFIGPYFADEHRVVAFSLAGMGESDWRDRYGFEDFARDAHAVAEATGLYDVGKPVYVGHSFGGGQVLWTAATYPERLRAGIIIDAAFRGPPPSMEEERRARLAEILALPPEQRPNRVYPDLATALARFRLMPPQPAENLYILDHIARGALKRAPLPDGSGEGWTWKFDPDMWEKLDGAAMRAFYRTRPEIPLPMANLTGEHSLLTAAIRRGEPSPFPASGHLAVVPEAHHHVMVDQPLALVAAMRALLAAWRA